MLIISNFWDLLLFYFFTSVFLAEWFARCFSLFWRGEFDIKSYTIELILLIPIGFFWYQMFVKGFTVGCKTNGPDFSIPNGCFENTFEIVLQATFKTVFQTFLVIIVNFFGVGHFVIPSA